MNWYKHPAINRSWLCEQLYGDRSKANTSKLIRKINQTGGQRLLPAELEKLEEIRKQLIDELNGKA